MDRPRTSREQTPGDSARRGALPPDRRTGAGATGRRGETGYSLIEVLVAVSIFGVVALAGLPHLDRGREDINTSIQRVVADMRYARGRAITSGEHYAVEWTGANTYEVQRMRLGGLGTWEVDRVERSVELPGHISFALHEDGVERLEFNTRGMMIASTKPLWPVISDLDHHVDRRLSIWPSGQIYVED
jgi:prepilin-type N-terminal cleavage/methylation domain-containing protein